ncbi:MAG: hypothetical protein QXV11_06650 [Desulfurococcaceae archaeon]
MPRVLVMTRYKPGSHGGLGTLLTNLKNSCNVQCDVSFYILYTGLNSHPLIENIGPLATIYTFLRDLKISLKTVCKDYADAVLYLGSVPLPSHVLAKLCSKPVILYVNGYLHYEHVYRFKNAIKRLDIREILGSIWTEVWTELLFGIGRYFVDAYVFPCYATYEFSMISSNKVHRVIPLWLSEQEISHILEQSTSRRKEDDEILLVAYTSNVYSPKILSSEHLVKLGYLVRNKTARNFEFLIIDPKSNQQKAIDNILIVNRLPRKKYLETLTRSILYVDAVIDDELRYSTLEAMLLGVPVAKITHPRYWDKLDFKYELFSTSIREFVERVAWYIDHAEELYPMYSSKVREYVLSKRRWNNVKNYFLEIFELIGGKH